MIVRSAYAYAFASADSLWVAQGKRKQMMLNDYEMKLGNNNIVSTYVNVNVACVLVTIAIASSDFALVRLSNLTFPRPSPNATQTRFMFAFVDFDGPRVSMRYQWSIGVKRLRLCFIFIDD